MLAQRCAALAVRWHDALVEAQEHTTPNASLIAHVTRLTAQMQRLLVAEVYDAEHARRLGAALAALPLPHHLVLSRTHSVWYGQLMLDMPDEDRCVLLPRLTTMLDDLVAGYVTEMRSDIRRQEEERARIDHDETMRVLRRDEAWLRMLVAALPVIDTRGIIQLVEGSGLQALGFASTTMIGRPVADICALLAPDEDAVVLRNWHRALAGETFSAVGTARQIMFETHYAPLHEHDGSRMGAVAVAINIAEHTRMANELVRMHQQLAVQTEAERVRLARDLHDDALQMLHGVGYRLELLVKHLEQPQLSTSQTVEVAVGVERARLEVLEVAEHLRDLVSELRPPMLEAFGLQTALMSYVERLHDDALAVGLTITTAIDATDLVVPDALALSLYRIVQEATRNVLRHSGASHMTLGLTMQATLLTLTVEDNGRGCIIPDDYGRLTWDDHYGLVGIAERAAVAGGTLRIRSAPGAGCSVEVQVPLPVRETAHG
jgi:PAS domain S-box-containing protein